MIDFNEYRLRDNPGITIGNLPLDVFNDIKNRISLHTNKNNEYNNQLIGQIEEEYKINLPSSMHQYLIKMVRDYQNKFNFQVHSTPRMVSSWVNLQKKYEYNPVHHHFNTLAWVAWIQIPYDINKESNSPNSIKATYKKNGAFEFIFTKLSGEVHTHTINLSKAHEGSIILFPKGLKHTVYPFFTSDDYRISVAGNIDLV